MKYFAGLDVSLEETVNLRDRRGRSDGARGTRLERAGSFGRVLPKAWVSSLERIGLEACSLSAWLHESLVAAGLPAVCIETRRAKAAMGAMPNKTDRNDARGPCPDHPHRLVPGRAREEPGLPVLACAADRTTAGAEQDA